MALFKIEQGLAADLVKNRPNSVQGYCYFTKDDGKFYIDIADGAAITPSATVPMADATRIPINSYMSDWAARAYADKDGDNIHTSYGTKLSIIGHTLKLIAKDSTELFSGTLPDTTYEIMNSVEGIEGTETTPRVLTATALKQIINGLAPTKEGVGATGTWSISINGNASTATDFQDPTNVTLTGDVTGSISSKRGWNLKTTIGTGKITNEKLAHSSITINDKIINLGETITLADLGLDAPLRFIGFTEESIVDGSTQNIITLKNGSSVTATIGDVIVNNLNDREYVWTGSQWEMFGDAGLADLSGYLPLTAGEDKKLIGPLGLTENVNYGATLPTTPFNGQLFYLEDNGTSVPKGGTTGQYLKKNSNTDGDAVWASFPIATADTLGMIKSGTDITIDASGNVSVNDNSHNHSNYLPLAGGTMNTNASIARAGLSASWYTGRNNALIKTTSYSGYNAITSMKTTNGSWEYGVYSNDVSYWTFISDTNYNAGTNAATTQMTLTSAGVLTASKVYGAVWNDYAEYRNQKQEIKPGYCAISNDDGSLELSTEMYQICDGIVSDTFGFAIGETDEAKTPLAVAGRVLAYCSGNPQDYHARDVVCAGPGGLVYKMTEEEQRMHPASIIGTVSEIPTYETWGTGNIKVDGRIWIKVK